jgi:hypothetical protein
MVIRDLSQDREPVVPAPARTDLQDPSPQTLTVPQRAIVREGAQARVWGMQGDHQLAPRVVTTGLEQEGYAQIVSGVTPGEQVVIDGGLLLSKMMEILAQSPGQSAEEIERYITIPIEIAVAGLPSLQHGRSISGSNPPTCACDRC